MNQKSQSSSKNLKTIWTVISGGLQLISALVTIATLLTFSFVTAVFANIFHQQNWITSLIPFVLGGIIAACCMLIFSFVRTSILLRKSPPRWTLRSYKYISTESFYKIDEDNPQHHTFRITTTIQAIVSGVNIFENTYRWTGQGKEEIPKVVSPGQVLLGETVSDSGWKYYYIHLGQPLNVGETTTIITVQELYDTENRFDPYLAKIISQPVDLLTLRIKLPRNSLPSKITFTKWDSEGPAGNIIKTEQGHIEHQTGEIIWKIKKPILGYKYEIRWKY